MQKALATITPPSAAEKNGTLFPRVSLEQAREGCTEREQRDARGHEKVPTCGQEEVPTLLT
jgi:hypothetical protein